MQITAVPPGHVANVLPQVMPHLVRLAPRTNGRSTVDDILRALLDGSHTLWLAFEENEDNRVYGVTITSFINYPRAKVLNVVYTAGNMLRLWQDRMLNVLHKWARDNHCDFIELTGRRGWLRMLKDWNVEEEFVVCRMHLQGD